MQYTPNLQCSASQECVQFFDSVGILIIPAQTEQAYTRYKQFSVTKEVEARLIIMATTTLGRGSTREYCRGGARRGGDMHGDKVDNISL